MRLAGSASGPARRVGWAPSLARLPAVLSTHQRTARTAENPSFWTGGILRHLCLRSPFPGPHGACSAMVVSHHPTARWRRFGSRSDSPALACPVDATSAMAGRASSARNWQRMGSPNTRENADAAWLDQVLGLMGIGGDHRAGHLGPVGCPQKRADNGRWSIGPVHPLWPFLDPSGAPEAIVF